MPSQLHDGLDAHRVIGEGGAEASAATVTGRPLKPCSAVNHLDQLAQGFALKSRSCRLAFWLISIGSVLFLEGCVSR